MTQTGEFAIKAIVSPSPQSSGGRDEHVYTSRSAPYGQLICLNDRDVIQVFW
jgi:hypothetical protein